MALSKKLLKQQAMQWAPGQAHVRTEDKLDSFFKTYFGASETTTVMRHTVDAASSRLEWVAHPLGQHFVVRTCAIETRTQQDR